VEHNYRLAVIRPRSLAKLPTSRLLAQNKVARITESVAAFYGALPSSPSRLTPKVQVLLDFLDEYLGTDRDPRLKNDVAAGYFSDRSLTPTSGP
jgi:hypothetical protein